MSRPVRVDWQHLTVTPWRNGGGQTREIICQRTPLPSTAPAADSRDLGQSGPQAAVVDFAWRASIATIDRDGEFSCFPGVDRQIALLAGGGVQLTDDQHQRHDLIVPAEPWAFAGETPICATLVAGVSQDFNIMTRRVDWQATLQPLRKGQLLPAGHSGVLWVLAGEWQLDDCGPGTLGSGQGAWWHLADSARHCRPGSDDALALWAHISPR